MKQYATYLRVSTQKQGNTQLGLTSQRNMCDVFIKEHKGILGMEFLDIESGTHRDRKGLWGAINYCQKNNCPLVIATLSRLARDVEFCFKVINTGIEIHFVDMPQINTLLLGVFASVAQYERELTSERTKKALAVKKSQGCRLGSSNPKYIETWNNKSKEQLKAEQMKRGETKRIRHQQSRDVQAFKKILRQVFPNDTIKENPQEWMWSNINTKNGNRAKILGMMKTMKEIDDTNSLFRRWDFNMDDRSLTCKLSSYICAFKKSFRV